jgi:hypothetical protein
MKSLSLIVSLFIFVNLNYSFSAQALDSILISSQRGELDAENFSFYEINTKGNLKIELLSIEGDVDMYASPNSKADFYNYEWQSVTYGQDEIFIEDVKKRPIYLSIYAHPYYPKSVYILNQYLIHKPVESNEHKTGNNDDNPDISQYVDHHDYKYHSDNDGFAESYHHHLNLANDKDSEEESESLLWNIFLHIIQFIIEVIL